MPSFNKVLLMGNLTRDPQLKYLPSQTACVEFGVACNRKFKTAGGEDREEVVFVDVTAFGKQGEVINEHFKKGKAIFLEGRLKFDSWESKDGGGKRSKLSIVVENFQFVGGRDSADQPHPSDDGDQRPQPARRPAPSSRPSIRDAFVPAVEMPDADSPDIPFAWEGPSRQPL